MISYLIYCSLQVQFVNDAIRKAQPCSKLLCLAPIADPSDEIIEVLLAALRWDMQQRRFGLTVVVWTNSMLYPCSCLNCSRKTCHTELGGLRAGISKRSTAFFTRCVIFCCLDGLRTPVTRALSMGTLITASVWPIVRTTRRYILRYCEHIPARVTCST
jgi:hypothetical protein